MISLVNAARIAAGKGTLGFVNPALYSLAATNTFTNDITSGANTCYETVCCKQGYQSVSGWDPVTGLGSVNFTAFKNLFVALGGNSVSPSAPSSSPTVKIAVSPSAQSTVRPTPQPTLRPTPQPTQAPGWVHMLEYTAPACNGSAVKQLESYPSGVCLPTGHASSQKYTCATGTYPVAVVATVAL